MAELGICDASIVALQNAMPSQANKITAAGMLKALSSPTNRTTIEVLSPQKEGHTSSKFNAATGKYIPTIRLRWYQPQVSESDDERSCNADTHEQHTEEDFALNLYRQRSFYLPVDRMQALCESANAVASSGSNGIRFNMDNTPVMNELANIMWSHLRPLVRDINADLFDKVITKIGTNVRTGLKTASNIPVFNATGTAFRFDGWTQVLDDFANNELSGNPIIVGGSLFNRFAIALGQGGSSDGGFDYSKLNNPFEFHYDATADTKLGANGFLGIASEVAAFVQKVRFTQYTKLGTSHFGTFVLDDLPGVEFDL